MNLFLDELSGYVWLAIVGVALVVLALGFAYVLARRHREALARVDAWLETRAPRAWRFTRRRFALDVWHGLALTAALLLAVGSVFAFAEVTEGWTDQAALYRIDRAVHERLDGAVDASTAAFFRAVTHAGDLLVASALTAALAILFVVRKRWWRLLALALTMVVGEAIVWGMKYLFARDRPEQGLAESAGASFPSGHSFTAMALYGFLVYLVWRSTLGRGAQIALSVVLAVLIVLVALSRVVLNVHWVSDVLGGLTIGLGWLVVSLVVARAARAWRHGGGIAPRLP